MKIVRGFLLLLLLAGCAQENGLTDQTVFEQHNKDGIRSIQASGYHSVILKDDGTVWTTGRNNAGQLGDGNKTNRSLWEKVNELPSIVSVTSKSDHTLAIDKKGAVWGWGYNKKGQICEGQEIILKLELSTKVQFENTPHTEIPLLSCL
jgi:alpha-tubulin suppressor-like RCC1 family protein